MLDNYIDNLKNDIINSVCDLIKFRSVSEEDFSNASHPFGENCSNALNYVLELGKSMGFRTKNLDNYCGYIEFGEGEELVGIIGHLDVVPAEVSDGWTTPPFEPSIRDGKIFGRGTIDDKGPVIASLYAMKAVFDNFKVNKRVRLILGLNEEKNWKCIEHYKETEEFPSISFSPDANFPGIYAEKGIISIKLQHPFYIENTEILNIDCNNNAINVVPKFCSITLKILDEKLENVIKNLSYSEKITIEELENHTFKISSFGTAAHAAHPELGDNAITNLVEFLLQEFEVYEEQNYVLLKTLYNLEIFEYNSPTFFSSENLPIIKDESGILTSNVASFDYENNTLSIKINLRVPVNTSLEFIEKRYNDLKTLFPNLQVEILSKQEPLYAKKDSYLVKTLVNIFNKKTGIEAEPIAIGGGTYARAFENSISYGLNFPGDADMCHQVDEFVEIDKLILGTKIYAEAIYQLAK